MPGTSTATSRPSWPSSTWARRASSPPAAPAGRPGPGARSPGKALWAACRASAGGLDDLAQRVEPARRLGRPRAARALLQAARDRRPGAPARRSTRTGASPPKGARGLGISALFAGRAAPARRMAAEVVASELGLDLYRVDLSQVVSKYIGETEKNLRRVFDAAEDGGAMLLFDEADALFGKRSEVKDSHDRYANIEVSYLLQRMEAYRASRSSRPT